MQHDFILLDRSGSMANLWTEALSSVNSYVRKLAEEKVDTGVTLTVFDTGLDGNIDFKVVRDRIVPSTWHDVSEVEVEPRGMTPLNDAVAKIVALANSGGYDKVVIIIMTDGYENASKELTTDQAKKLLDDCRAKGWQVIFLGANFDNVQQARSLGGLRGQTVNSSPKNMRATMTATATMSANYATSGASMDFSDDFREAAKN